eukprot:4841153-Amphidinium_carterae.4
MLDEDELAQQQRLQATLLEAAPEEVVQQEPEVPVQEDEAQQAERADSVNDESDDYKDIVQKMYQTWLDESSLDQTQELHEGVC